MKNNYTFSKKMRTRAGVLSLLGMGIGTLLMTQNALAQPPGFGGEQGGPGGGQGGQGGRGGFGGPGGGQGGPGGFGGGGFQGGPGGFQGGRMGMLRTVSAASLPLRVMVSYLGLTDAQTGKIALVREDMQDAMRPQMGQRPGQPQGQPRGDSQGQQPQGRQGNQRSQGNQGNPQAMQAAMQVAEKKATTEINAVLSDDQKTKLATLVKAIKALQDGGIRPDAALKLKLTEEQLAKLAGGTAVEEVLTTEQQNIAENYRMPAGGFGGGPGGPGGPGGFGGPPQGGPGQGGFGGGQGGFGSPPPPPDGSEGEVGGPEGNPPPSL